ncbi:MAG: TIGR03862 family flavoprotein, partial [Gluconacetobacter diazotrophicus]|nr:TIGR03862 family flavoprotein [Gluconacetobacter diazotrophicus]
SGRVFPRGQQAAAPLRRWVSRLRTAGVSFHARHRLERIAPGELIFRETPTGTLVTARARVVVLALGGASWPETGSDGTWPAMLAGAVPAIRLEPWQAANCGWEVAWDPRVLAAAEGQPLKNIAAAAGGVRVTGEALITRYGLEGGTLYQLGRELRAALPSPCLEIDFKPDTFAERLLHKLPSSAQSWDDIARYLKLSPAARAVLQHQNPPAADPPDQRTVVSAIKRFPLALHGPRPVAEAISSAGGVRWEELDEALMLRRMPGVFVAGEMIDWEAPTGGYLLQGCFATGTRAGQAAARWLAVNPGTPPSA